MNKDWGVIFDLDGTIVNTAAYHEEAWIEAGRLHKVDITRDYYYSHIHSHTNEDIVKTLFGPEADPQKGLALANDKEVIFRKNYKDNIVVTDGFFDFLENLNNSGIGCAIATNAPPGNVDLILDELQIRDKFQAVITDDEVENGKPDPEIFLTAASLLNLPISKCLIFEDSIPGLKGAQASGAQFITMAAFLDGEDLPPIADQGAAVAKDFTQMKIDQLGKLFK